MAVLNFPDPAAQTPANTFSPTSTPDATSNGVTYVWTDGSWSIASVSNGGFLDKDEADSYYVEQSGDNMTGNLTLGTDKIMLQATGSSTFRGRFRNGAVDDNVTVITETGIIQSYRGAASPTVDCFQSFDSNNPGVPTGAWHSDGSIELSGTYQSDPNISLNADGSAEFAGSMGIGRSSSPSANLSTLATAAKPIGLAAYREDGSGTNGKGLQIAYGNTVNASIGWDGFAQFYNNVNVSSSNTPGNAAALYSEGFFLSTRSTSDAVAFQANLNNSQNVIIKADGSATFAGNVVVSSSNPATAGADAGCYFQQVELFKQLEQAEPFQYLKVTQQVTLNQPALYSLMAARRLLMFIQEGRYTEVAMPIQERPLLPA